MKFNWGATPEQKAANINRKSDAYDRWYRKITSWHLWWAWHPVLVDEATQEYRWLEYVEAKATYHSGGLWPTWTWEYRSYW